MLHVFRSARGWKTVCALIKITALHSEAAQVNLQETCQKVNASHVMLHVQERSGVEDCMCADQHDSSASRGLSNNLASLLSCTCLNCNGSCSGALEGGRLCVR